MSKYLDKEILVLALLAVCLLIPPTYSQFCPNSRYNLEKKAAKTCHDKGGLVADGQCILAFPLD
jgi:hypothetical protein